MKVVYIAHPLGSGVNRDSNRYAASQWVMWAAEQGVAPIADWIILSGGWDESKREQGLAIDLALIERCDEIWLCGAIISPGMQIELDHAISLGKIWQRFFTGPAITVTAAWLPDVKGHGV